MSYNETYFLLPRRLILLFLFCQCRLFAERVSIAPRARQGGLEIGVFPVTRTHSAVCWSGRKVIRNRSLTSYFACCLWPVSLPRWTQIPLIPPTGSADLAFPGGPNQKRKVGQFRVAKSRVPLRRRINDIRE